MAELRGSRAAEAAQAMLILRQRERKRRMESYRDDPVRYAIEELKVTLTPDQESILRSVVNNRRTAVKASHAIGKSFCAAVLSNWWYDCWDQHIVYITAPTWQQAVDRTFKQTKILRMRLGLPGQVQEKRVRDEDRLKEPGHFIQAINAETGESFQGEHTAPILIVMEEAVGVPGYIWEASDGLMTHPSNRIIAIANPTNEATKFGEVCGDKLWSTLTVRVFDHPNIARELECEPPIYPDAVSLLWLREMLEKHCEIIGELTGDAFSYWSLETLDAAIFDKTPVSKNRNAQERFYKPNAEFQGRALGIFPTQADEQVIPRSWVEMLEPQPAEGEPAVGCDPARSGSDRTAVAGVVGPCVVDLREARHMTLEAVTGVCIDAARAVGKVADRSEYHVKIKVDVTGGLGAGPVDALVAQGYDAEGVNFSENARKHKEFPNRRSEVWWEVRERVRTREFDISRLPAEIRKSLVRELTAPKMTWDRKSRRIVQPKAEIKKELGMSPDLAEAVAIAYAPSHKRVERPFHRVPIRGLW